MANLGDMVVRIVGDSSSLRNDIDRTETRFQAASKKLSGIGVTLAKSLAVSFVAIGAASIKAAADMEVQQAAFETLLGSADKAKKLLSELTTLAAKTPFQLSDLSEASKTMLSFGIALEDILPNVRMLGDIAQGDAQKLKSLTLAFSQIQSTGRLMGQDLLQLINAGFNPLTIISEKTGKTMAQLKKEMERGAISADQVSEAFKIATSEGGLFFNGMERASKTLSGQFSTLKDDTVALGRSIGNILLPYIKEALPIISSLVQNLTQFVDKIIQARTEIEAMESAQKSQPKTLREVQLALAGVNSRLEEQRQIRKQRADEGFDTVVQDKEIASLVKLQTELKSLQKEYTLIEQNKKTVAAATTTVVQKTEEEIDAYKKLIDDRTKLISESYAGLEQAAQSQFDFEKGIIDAINRGRESAHQEELRRIDEEKQQRKEAFQFAYSALDSIIDGVYSNEIARIEQSELSEEEKARKISQIKRKQAQWDKAQAVADIAMNTASAIVKALPNFVIAAIVAAMGAAQAAVALSTPLPEVPAFAEGGIVQPQPGGVQATVAEAGVAEAIIPLDRLDNMLSGMGGGTTHLIVNLDSRPLLDKIFDATRNGTVLISSGAVV